MKIINDNIGFKIKSYFENNLILDIPVNIYKDYGFDSFLIPSARLTIRKKSYNNTINDVLLIDIQLSNNSILYSKTYIYTMDIIINTSYIRSFINIEN